MEISLLSTQTQAETCATMMAASEPWITLGRDFAASLAVITNPSREIYVVEIGAEIVGFTILWLEGPFVGYIQSICVAPQYHGQGIGTRLITYAENRIFKEYPNVFICVSSFNPGAQRLYENLGYQFIGEMRDYLIPGASEFLFRKTISPISTFQR